MQEAVSHSSPAATVSLDELAEAEVRVGISPMPTLGLLTFASVEQRPHIGVPPRVASAVRAELRETDLTTLAPMTGRPTPPPSLVGKRVAPPNGFPRIICGDPEPGTNSLADELERIVELDPDEFHDSVLGCARESTAGGWEALFEDPARWLRRYAVAMARAWRAVEPIWRNARGVLEREVERVESSVERGASRELLVDLHPRTTVAGGRWHVPTDRAPGPYDVRNPFVLCPTITDPTATVVFSDREGKLPSLVYASDAGWRALDGDPPPTASLEALLGPPRARILRALERRRPAGELADALQLSPSAATYHLRHLEAAGLVLRERCGRRVMVARTRRGTELLGLYGG